MNTFEMLDQLEKMQHECDQEGLARGEAFIRTKYEHSGKISHIEFGLFFGNSAFGPEEQYYEVYPDGSVIPVGG